MNSTTITIGLVVVALAVGGWILLRGGKEEDEEVETGGSTPPPAAPVHPQAQAQAQVPGGPAGPAPAAPHPPAPAPAGVPQTAPMSSVPYGAQPGYGQPYGGGGGQYGGGGGQYLSAAPLTSEAHAYEVRTRWQELQLRFVDDPQTAAGEAERLVDDALAGVTASLNARKDQLSNWRVSGRDDTEQLRAAVHGYRDFLNHLVGT
ncbi:hypothetical protein AB0M46_48050 [Dactylosporangium sp. NPDC051485]|uniref:hypothetical protein n=1 Tax=Dactylosporangium sp. NPDC051485 TaxID=3154846 RepID=UPI003422C148